MLYLRCLGLQWLSVLFWQTVAGGAKASGSFDFDPLQGNPRKLFSQHYYVLP